MKLAVRGGRHRPHSQHATGRLHMECVAASPHWAGAMTTRGGPMALLVRVGGVRLSPREWVAATVSVCGLLLLALWLPGDAPRAATASWTERSCVDG